MRILISILLILLFAQSYFFYHFFQKNTALRTEYEDAVLAIRYHEKKNLEMIKQVQLAKNETMKMDAELTMQKMDYSALKTKNDQLRQSINQLEQKNNSQEILIQQKNNEIIILKNELLKYFSE